tara:strand:+ start:3250 stop:4953 length:1704 start_codon:yes stop_codon:yes gene_type:complete
MATQVQFGDENKSKSDLRLLSANEIAGAKKESDKYGAGAKLFSNLAGSVDTGNFMGNPVYTGGKDVLQGLSLMLGYQAQRADQKASTIEDLGKQEEGLTEDFIKSSLIRTSDAPANMEGDKDDEYSRDAFSALAGKSQEGLEHIALEAHNGVGFARIKGFDGNYYRVPISNEEFLSLAKMREKARLDRERYAYREKKKQYGLDFLPEFAVSLNLDPNEEGLIRGVLNSGEAPRGFFETIQQMKLNGEDILPYVFSQGHNAGVTQYRKSGNGKTVTDSLLFKERDLSNLRKAYVNDGMNNQRMEKQIAILKQETNELSDYQSLMPVLAEQGGDMFNLVTQAKSKNKSMEFLLNTLEVSAARNDGGGLSLYKKTEGAYTSRDIEEILKRIDNMNTNMGFSQPLSEEDVEELRVALHARHGVIRDASKEEENKRKLDREKNLEQSTLENPIPPDKKTNGISNRTMNGGTKQSVRTDVMDELKDFDRGSLQRKANIILNKGISIDNEYYTSAYDEKLLEVPPEKIRNYVEHLMRTLTITSQKEGMTETDAEMMAFDILTNEAPRLLELYRR